MRADSFTLRPATLADADAASELLAASYAPLLDDPAYERETIARALPLMVRAQPALLGSGTWHLAERPDGRLIGCGGWTAERPQSGELEPGLAHLRHFGTHPEHLRLGVGRALVERCFAEAAARGRTRWECGSSLPAVAFYSRMGFEVVERRGVSMGPELELPAVIMSARLPGSS